MRVNPTNALNEFTWQLCAIRSCLSVICALDWSPSSHCELLAQSMSLARDRPPPYVCIYSVDNTINAGLHGRMECVSGNVSYCMLGQCIIIFVEMEHSELPQAALSDVQVTDSNGVGDASETWSLSESCRSRMVQPAWTSDFNPLAKLTNTQTNSHTYTGRQRNLGACLSFPLWDIMLCSHMLKANREHSTKWVISRPKGVYLVHFMVYRKIFMYKHAVFKRL